MGAFETTEIENTVSSGVSSDTGIIGEASKYLQVLGYDEAEVLPILKRIAPDYDNVSQLVSGVLREFGER